MKKLIISEALTSGTLVSVDVQPEYNSYINRSFNLSDYAKLLNKHKGTIVILYNGEELGMISESELIEWLYNIGVKEQTIDRATFYDKGYAFFRYCMDSGIDEDDIVQLVRFMRDNDINDSRDIDEESWDNFIEQFTSNQIRDLLEYADDCISIPDLMDFIQNYSNITLIGGGINECLKEVEIALKALNKPYKTMDEFVY